MATHAARYATLVEDRAVYVQTGGGRLWVGDLDEIIDLVGGPAWTITYSDYQKQRHPDLDTSDEGLTVDVVDVMAAMTHDESFVESLRALPAEASEDVSPRLGLFVGRLLGDLQTGLE